MTYAEGSTRVLPGSSTRPRLVEATAVVEVTARSRLGGVVAGSALGLLVQAVGIALARAGGSGATAVDLWLSGVAVVFASSAWRLLGTRASRNERLQVALVLGGALFVASFLSAPLFASGYDEMLHQTTLWHLLAERQLFGKNPLLPVSPYYPGLELVTAAVKWLTGLPSDAAQLVVDGLSRMAVVLALFLFVERVSHSGRVAGLAVLVFTLGPQFFSFDAAYSYQTIALAFGAAAVYFLMVACDHPEVAGRRRWGLLSLAAIAGTVVSHHLVGWLTVGLVVVWAVALTIDARRDASLGGQAAVVRLVALGGLLVATGWTAFTAPVVFPYLSPIFGEAWASLIHLLTTASHRALFHAGAGPATPLWQEALVALSVLVGMGLVAAALWSMLRRPGLPGPTRRLIPAVVALGYVLVLVSPLEQSTAQIGQRSTTFAFFGIALGAAVWLSRRRPRVALLTVLATATFVGSLIFGSGPSWSYVPGPYVPSADNRSIDQPSIAAAEWASTHLPVDAPIAADRDNAALMASLGHLWPVSEVSGEANVGFLYFAHQFGRYGASVVRRYRIRYVLVDQRLATGPPATGTYFDPGAPGPGQRNRLTKEELDKFAHVRGLRLVYDNGPIRIYSTAGLLHAGGPATRTPPIGQGFGQTEPWVLAAALVTLAAWLWRLRRRRRPLSGDRALAYLVGGMCAAVALMFAYIPTRWSTQPLAGVVLGGLFTLAVAGAVRDRRRAGKEDSAAVPRVGGWPERALLALGVLGGALAIGLAVVAARHDWARPGSSTAALRSAPVAARPARAVEPGPGRAP